MRACLSAVQSSWELTGCVLTTVGEHQHPSDSEHEMYLFAGPQDFCAES